MPRRDDDRTPAWRRYLRFWRADVGGDVDDELAFHLESTIDELVATGMPREAARDAARRKFGDVERISRTLHTLGEHRERTMTRGEWWHTIKQDIAFGLRQLRKSPAFTAIALVTLALGIGANSAIFSVVYSVLLEPLPYAGGERLLSLDEKVGDSHNSVTFGNYESWRQQSRSFEALGATWGSNALTLTGAGDPTPLVTTRANSDYWKAAFIPPVLGRYFSPEEDRVGAPNVVVISRALWENRFKADPGILGKLITLGGVPRTIVGVAPSEYILAPPAEQVWIPLRISPSQMADHADHELSVFGLVRRGVPISDAIRELSRIETALAKQYPNSGFDDVRAERMADAVVGDQKSILLTLFGAVGLVLLIACANVANLLLARAAARRGEIAIRGALGASRARIVMQLLIESLLLGIGGGLLGLVVAGQGVRFLVTSPAAIARLHDTTLNAPVVAFTLAVSIGCALIFGLVPALRASRTDLQQTLRDGGRESAVTSRERLRGLLVVGELCLTQVLLVGAGLLIRSALLAYAVPPGFEARNLLVANVLLPGARYGSGALLESGFERLDEAIAAIPGIKAAGRVSHAPIDGRGMNWTVLREGSNGHDDGAVVANMRGANPGALAALGVPLLRGRAFTTGDAAGAPPVAIISRGLARSLFGDADPIGRRISNGSGDPGTWREVVGVIGDMRASGLTIDPPLEMYMPAAQWPANSQMAYVIRGSVPVTTLVPAIRKAVTSVDPLLALTRVQTMDDAIDNRLALPRFTMWLLTLLGGTGLVLAVVGVYGVIAYFVNQRTHELGVRMALGASGGNVRWMVVRQGLVFGVLGVVIGTGVAYGASRFLATLTYGVTVHDPMTYASVAVLLTVVAACASYLPARRATRIDPMEALRSS